jgi:dTDP-4-amino-4,6-dideoxygalactose transaminase
MKVPFLDLKASYDELAGRVEPAILRASRSGWYIGGTEVEAFEKTFADYCGAAHAVAVANGLEALELALRAYGVGVGDEVIVPTNTFIATWLAVSRTGATLVPVEPDEATHCIGAERIHQSITKRTKAILPVHLYGQPADLDAILEVSVPCGIVVIEDAAQAHGAKYKGRRVSGGQYAAAWSFYPAKNLGALGDAGAVTTNDPQIAERLAMLRNYGSRTKYVNEVEGLNSRMDPVQAAVLSVKVEMLDEWNARRKSVAERYLSAFRRTSLVLPSVPNWADPVWHLFVVRHPNRDLFMQKLAERGVQTQIHYPIPPHEQRAYAHLGYAPQDFPLAHQLAKEVISLPIGPHMKDSEVDYVIDSVLATAELGN